MQETNDRYALVTVASMGIGYELAKLFAEDGYNLILVSRTKEDLEKAATEFAQYGINVVTLPADLFNPQAPFELYDAVKTRNLTVDVLVNDAGQGQFGLFVQTYIRRQMEIIQLNVSSLTALTHLFLKDMVAR